MSNVLLDEWTGPYGGVPPWDRVRAEDFPEALATALAERRAAVERIARNPEPPTFENTLVAMERTGQALGRVLRLFAVMRQNLSTPEYRALEREWQREKQRLVIRHRYGLDECEVRTLEELADSLDLTRERVRQIQLEALGQLRRIIKRRGVSKDVLL